MRISIILGCFLTITVLSSCQKPEKPADTSSAQTTQPATQQTQPKSDNSGVFSFLSEDNERLAEKDPLKFFEKALKQYDDLPVKDYTMDFFQQERIDGSLSKVQDTFVKFRGKPFSVYMKWLTNPAGASQLIYVEGKYKNDKGVSQIVIQPSGGISQFLTGGSVLRVPTAPDVLKESIYPINLFGLRQEVSDFVEDIKIADKSKEAHYKFDGIKEFDKKTCAVFEVCGPDKPPFYAPKKVLYLDVKTLLPARITYYEKNGDIRADYKYKNIKLNVGLTDKDFLPSTYGITDRD